MTFQERIWKPLKNFQNNQQALLRPGNPNFSDESSRVELKQLMFETISNFIFILRGFNLAKEGWLVDKIVGEGI